MSKNDRSKTAADRWDGFVATVEFVCRGNQRDLPLLAYCLAQDRERTFSHIPADCAVLSPQSRCRVERLSDRPE